MIRRREFITLLGGAAAVWPLAARAQQTDRVRRIGALMGGAENADGRAWVAGFVQGLSALGWTAGRNMELDVRWAAGETQAMNAAAAELAKLARVVGAFPDGNSALNLAAARLRHIAGTAWSSKRYLNIELLKDQQMRGAITA
jgi:hypothetical protein